MYDLNVRSPSQRDKEMKSLLKRSQELGWDCVAWNISIAGKIGNSGAKPMKPLDFDVIFLREVQRLRTLANSNIPAAKFRQVSRLTVTVDEVVDAHALTAGNEILRAFDIVAARAGNTKVFAYLCKHADIDLITIDFTHRLPFLFNKKILDEAVSRGIGFEICYSSILGTAGARREVFSNTRVMLQYLRGRNVILSSGADSMSLLRGPADVCNVGRALGLTQQQALHAVGENCATVLKHALARRCRYLPVEITSKAEFKKRWSELDLLQSSSSAAAAALEKKGSLKKVQSVGNMSTISSTASANDDDASDGDDDQKCDSDGSEIEASGRLMGRSEGKLDDADSGVNGSDDKDGLGEKSDVDDDAVSDHDNDDDGFMDVSTGEDADGNIGFTIGDINQPITGRASRITLQTTDRSNSSTKASKVKANNKQNKISGTLSSVTGKPVTTVAVVQKASSEAQSDSDDSDFSLGDSDDDDNDDGDDDEQEKEGRIDISRYDDHKASRGLGSDDFVGFGDNTNNEGDDDETASTVRGAFIASTSISSAVAKLQAKGTKIANNNKSGSSTGSSAMITTGAIIDKKSSKKRQLSASSNDNKLVNNLPGSANKKSR